MTGEYPTLTLIEEEGHTNEWAESSRKRIDAAFALMAEYAAQWDDLLYGPGGGVSDHHGAPGRSLSNQREGLGDL
jgi:hypothetical protein